MLAASDHKLAVLRSGHKFFIIFCLKIKLVKYLPELEQLVGKNPFNLLLFDLTIVNSHILA